MPLQMDEDGNIIDKQGRRIRVSEPRHRARESGSPASAGPRTADIARPTEQRAPTAPSGGSPAAGRYGVPTVPVGHRSDRDDGRTQIYRDGPDALSPDDAGAAGRNVRSGSDPMADPPVGWLTIIDGPGRGHVVTLGIGVNSIGRDRGERVSLDYGDQTISRTNHAAITYDPRGRKFYVQHGGGTNLTYVNDKPVLAPRELEPLTHVQMGSTVLRFVPLCGVDFSWDNETDSD